MFLGTPWGPWQQGSPGARAQTECLEEIVESKGCSKRSTGPGHQVLGSDHFSSANLALPPPWRTLNRSSAEGVLTLPDLPYRAAAGRTAVEALGQCHGGGHRSRNVPEPRALGRGGRAAAV